MGTITEIQRANIKGCGDMTPYELVMWSVIEV